MTIRNILFSAKDKTVYLKAYMLDNVDGLPFCEKRPGILILPGGGYEFCSAREGEPVAMHYLAEGYNAFVYMQQRRDLPLPRFSMRPTLF